MLIDMLKRNGRNIRRLVLQSDDDIAGSIPRAAKVIACLGRDICTISEIAAHCKLAKSTVHRVLKLLEASYMVTEDTSERKYYLGPLLTQLTINPSRTHGYFIKCAEKEMNRLSNMFMETVCLDILSGIQSVPLYEIPSLHEKGFPDQSRRLGLLCIGASSKVLMSQLSDERLKTGMKYISIPRLTENTVTDKNILLSEILEIRNTGYAVSNGERNAGIICVSAPVMNYTSPASISIVGPEGRLQPRLDNIISELKASCCRISESILGIFSLRRKQVC